jgi:lactate dehydrogenase-like 2-hydroxyacid dehydrogenase
VLPVVADITAMLVLMTMRRVEEGIQLIKSGGVSGACCPINAPRSLYRR